MYFTVKETCCQNVSKQFSKSCFLSSKMKEKIIVLVSFCEICCVSMIQACASDVIVDTYRLYSIK